MRIVISGGVGSGKSTVLAYLRNMLGQRATFRDVDTIVRHIRKNPEMYFSGEELDRWIDLVTVPFMRDRIFKDAEFRDTVERMTAPHVIAELAKVPDTEFDIVEFPIFFEKCTIEDAKRFDKLIWVTADEMTRRDRCLQRGWSLESINDVFRIQATDEQRKDFIDLISPPVVVHRISTDFTMADTVNQCEEIFRSLDLHK